MNPDHAPTRKLLTLLSACDGNRNIIRGIVAEAIAGTAAWRLWEGGEQYIPLSPAGRQVVQKLSRINPNQRDAEPLAAQYEYYNNLKELLALAGDSEAALMQGSVQKLSLLNTQWLGYCRKVASRMLLEKLRAASAPDVQRIKKCPPPDAGSLELMVRFMADLENIPQSTLSNITNLHIFNCFDIYSREFITEMPSHINAAQYKGIYKAYMTPYEVVMALYPDKLFCIQQDAYDAFVRQLH